MNEKNVLTALDIGSDSIKLLVLVKDCDDTNIVKLTEPVSSEVRKGVVVDVPGMTRLIEKIITKAEEKIERKIEDVYLAINGSHLSCFFSPGVVSVSRADQKISQEDIERVLQNCKILPLKSNQNRIIETFSRGFVVDGEGKVKNPVGLKGSRLEAEIIAVCGFSPYLDNSINSVLNSGLDINHCFPAPVASANAVLSNEDKEAGVIVLDIGACTTDMTVYQEGKLVHTKVFPIGSRNITYDIAVYFKIDVDAAERIKIEFGDLLSAKNKKIKVQAEEEEVSFSQKELKKVIEARVLEILRLVKTEIKSMEQGLQLPAGVVLTGGGSKMTGLKELTKKEFKLASKVRSALEEEELNFSVAWGLVQEAKQELTEESGFQIKEKIKKIIKRFIP